MYDFRVLKLQNKGPTVFNSMRRQGWALDETVSLKVF